MPYVTRERARELTAGHAMTAPGDLAFILSAEIKRYFRRNGVSFTNIAGVLGALDTTRSEFVRRVVEPYELGKLTAGGADPFKPVAEEAQAAHVQAMHASMHPRSWPV